MNQQRQIEDAIQDAVLLAALKARNTREYHEYYCSLAAPYRDQPHVQDAFAVEAQRLARIVDTLPEVST